MAERHAPRRFGLFGYVFLLAWLSGWSVGTWFLLRQVWSEPSVQHVAFAVPFVVAELVVAGLLLTPLVRWIARRRGPSKIAADERKRHARQWLESRRLLRDTSTFTAPDLGAPPPVAKAAPGAGHGEILLPGPRERRKPKRSALRHYASPGEVLIWQRGWSAAAVGSALGALGIALFWNGIVSVFVIELIRDFHWFLALFLVPFVVVGVVLAAAAVTAAGQLLLTTVWAVRRSELEITLLYGPIRGRRTYRFTRISHLELRRPGSRKWLRRKRVDGRRGAELWAIDTSGDAIAALAPLREPEARWIADLVYRNVQAPAVDLIETIGASPEDLAAS